MSSMRSNMPKPPHNVAASTGRSAGWPFDETVEWGNASIREIRESGNGGGAGDLGTLDKKRG